MSERDTQKDMEVFDPLSTKPTKVGDRTKNASGKGVYGTLTAVKGGVISTVVLHGVVGQLGKDVVHGPDLVISTREQYLELIEAAGEPMTASARAHKWALRAYYRFRLPLGDKRDLLVICRLETFRLGLEESEYIRQALIEYPGNPVLRFMQLKGKVNSHRHAMAKYDEAKSRRTRELDAKYGPLKVPTWDDTRATFNEAEELERAYVAAQRAVGGPPELPNDPTFRRVKYTDGREQTYVTGDFKALFNPITMADTVRHWKLTGTSQASSVPGDFNPDDFTGVVFTTTAVAPAYTAGASWSDDASPAGQTAMQSENPAYQGPRGGTEKPPVPTRPTDDLSDAEILEILLEDAAGKPADVIAINACSVEERRVTFEGLVKGNQVKTPSKPGLASRFRAAVKRITGV